MQQNSTNISLGNCHQYYGKVDEVGRLTAVKCPFSSYFDGKKCKDIVSCLGYLHYQVVISIFLLLAVVLCVASIAVALRIGIRKLFKPRILVAAAPFAEIFAFVVDILTGYKPILDFTQYTTSDLIYKVLHLLAIGFSRVVMILTWFSVKLNGPRALLTESQEQEMHILVDNGQQTTENVANKQEQESHYDYAELYKTFQMTPESDEDEFKYFKVRFSMRFTSDSEQEKLYKSLSEMNAQCPLKTSSPVKKIFKEFVKSDLVKFCEDVGQAAAEVTRISVISPDDKNYGLAVQLKAKPIND
ncbi:hypothetical protein QR680_014519 [Steinernema hermaphroditum]|uniref:Uncharacterized protein n=1 Tax=Steinernema hermaphroditum TaxID=289476 RepID=A0AA39M415_9BILA|nr:hypothetical protein QR680_014519 [Steinernema hermaphroditum]